MGANSHQDSENPGKLLFRLFTSLMGWEAIEVIGKLLRIAHRILQANISEGMYEVLEYEGRLELIDQERRARQPFFTNARRCGLSRTTLLRIKTRHGGMGKYSSITAAPQVLRLTATRKVIPGEY